MNKINLRLIGCGGSWMVKNETNNTWQGMVYKSNVFDWCYKTEDNHILLRGQRTRKAVLEFLQTYLKAEVK